VPLPEIGTAVAVLEVASRSDEEYPLALTLVVVVDNNEVLALSDPVKLSTRAAKAEFAARSVDPPEIVSAGTTSPDTVSAAFPIARALASLVVVVAAVFDEMVTASIPAAATSVALMPAAIAASPEVVDTVVLFNVTVTASLVPVASASPNVKVPV